MTWTGAITFEEIAEVLRRAEMELTQALAGNADQETIPASLAMVAAMRCRIEHNAVFLPAIDLLQQVMSRPDWFADELHKGDDRDFDNWFSTCNDLLKRREVPSDAEANLDRGKTPTKGHRTRRRKGLDGG